MELTSAITSKDDILALRQEGSALRGVALPKNFQRP